jgi:aryl-alcohol dehydrogenase-like predicted oxidoreductase
MGMSDVYGPADENESIATMHAALDGRVTLLDTGDFYGMGHNELLIRDALRGRTRDDVVLSHKFGVMRAPDRMILGIDARPASVKNFLTSSLRRLGPITSTSTDQRGRSRRADRRMVSAPASESFARCRGRHPPDLS